MPRKFSSMRLGRRKGRGARAAAALAAAGPPEGRSAPPDLGSGFKLSEGQRKCLGAVGTYLEGACGGGGGGSGGGGKRASRDDLDSTAGTDLSAGGGGSSGSGSGSNGGSPSSTRRDCADLDRLGAFLDRAAAGEVPPSPLLSLRGAPPSPAMPRLDESSINPVREEEEEEEDEEEAAMGGPANLFDDLTSLEVSDSLGSGFVTVGVSPVKVMRRARTARTANTRRGGGGGSAVDSSFDASTVMVANRGGGGGGIAADLGGDASGIVVEGDFCDIRVLCCGGGG